MSQNTITQLSISLGLLQMELDEILSEKCVNHQQWLAACSDFKECKNRIKVLKKQIDLLPIKELKY